MIGWQRMGVHGSGLHVGWLLSALPGFLVEFANRHKIGLYSNTFKANKVRCSLENCKVTVVKYLSTTIYDLLSYI